MELKGTDQVEVFRLVLEKQTTLWSRLTITPGEAAIPDPQVLRQKAAGPTCVSVNVFSGRVIALATNAEENIAKQVAQEAAQNARRPLVEEDEARACPNNCVQASSSTGPRYYGDPLLSVLADPDAPQYVAYHRE